GAVGDQVVEDQGAVGPAEHHHGGEEGDVGGEGGGAGFGAKGGVGRGAVPGFGEEWFAPLGTGEAEQDEVGDHDADVEGGVAPLGALEVELGDARGLHLPPHRIAAGG